MIFLGKVRPGAGAGGLRTPELREGRTASPAGGTF